MKQLTQSCSAFGFFALLFTKIMMFPILQFLVNKDNGISKLWYLFIYLFFLRKKKEKKERKRKKGFSLSFFLNYKCKFFYCPCFLITERFISVKIKVAMTQSGNRTFLNVRRGETACAIWLTITIINQFQAHRHNLSWKLWHFSVWLFLVGCHGVA